MARYIELAPQLVRLYRLNLDCKEVIKEFLLTAVPADVRENVHAHWEEADKYGNRRCSNCKSVEHVPTLMGKPIVWDFCPNCGAEMDERRDDELQV